MLLSDKQIDVSRQVDCDGCGSFVRDTLVGSQLTPPALRSSAKIVPIGTSPVVTLKVFVIHPTD